MLSNLNGSNLNMYKSRATCVSLVLGVFTNIFYVSSIQCHLYQLKLSDGTLKRIPPNVQPTVSYFLSLTYATPPKHILHYS